MEYKNIALLDLTGCQYLGELHKRIKEALLFPDHYGENWDAFWDSLRFDSPVDYVKITGEHTMPQELKSHLEIMHELLQDCKEECAQYGQPFDYEIVD